MFDFRERHCLILSNIKGAEQKISPRRQLLQAVGQTELRLMYRKFMAEELLGTEEDPIPCTWSQRECVSSQILLEMFGP